MVDKPAIQYVVEEAVAAGLDDLLMITGRAKTSLEDHFDRRPDLEQTLLDKGDEARAALVAQTSEPRPRPLRPAGAGAGARACGAAGVRACGQRSVRGAARRRLDRRGDAGVAADGAGSGALRGSVLLLMEGLAGGDLVLWLRRGGADR